MSRPKVIACVPSYNAENFIKKTLQCLANQTYSNFEVLISDDSSTDNTISVIQSFIRNDDRFVLIQQETNVGWVDNINFLMGNAIKRGEYIFIMPHDDHIKPDYIQKLITALEKNPQAVIAFSDMECIYADRETTILQYHQLNGITDRRKRTKKLLQLIGNWGTAYRGMTRRDAVIKLIPLKKNSIGRSDFALDWIWLVQLSLQGEFIRTPEVLYRKYYQTNSASFLWRKNDSRFSSRLIDSNRNFVGLLLNCSGTIWQSAISPQEKLIYQLTILTLLSKHLVQDSRLLIMKLLNNKTVVQTKKS